MEPAEIGVRDTLVEAAPGGGAPERFAQAVGVGPTRDVPEVATG